MSLQKSKQANKIPSKLTPEVLKGFVGGVLSSRYDNAVETPDCHLEWWKLCLSKARLVAIAAPRNHAKTGCITHAYLLASLLFREADFAMIVSDTEQQAKDFLKDITIDLTSNDDLIELFQISGFEKETESEIIVRFKDGALFKVLAKGAGQKVRGLKWNQKRPNLIVIDDLENDENVNTKEQRVKLKRWINGALIPCMGTTGRLRAVGTVIHSDSWLAGTLPDDNSPLTIHRPLKVYSNVPSNGWLSARYRAHPGVGDYSQFLWESHLGEQFYREEYSRALSDGMVDVYSAEHLNNPLDATQAYFKKDDFRPLPKNLPNLNYYAAVDFAISKSQTADYTAIAVVGIDDAGNLYLVEMVHGRLDPNESVAAIFDIEKRYNPGMFLVEKGTLAHSMGAMLRNEMRRRRSYPNLHPVSTSGDKRAKARGIQKIMRGGSMYFNMTADWFPAFEDELLRFDRGRHDDQVDAVALIGLKLDMLLDAPTDEELADEEYQEEFGNTIDNGRSEVTGY